MADVSSPFTVSNAVARVRWPAWRHKMVVSVPRRWHPLWWLPASSATRTLTTLATPETPRSHGFVILQLGDLSSRLRGSSIDAYADRYLGYR